MIIGYQGELGCYSYNSIKKYFKYVPKAFKTFEQVFIALNNNQSQIEILKNKWMKDIKDVSGKKSVVVPLTLIVIPSVLGIGLIFLSMCLLWYNYEEKNENYESMRRVSTVDYVFIYFYPFTFLLVLYI